jgi:hypothetical protein
MAIAIMGGLSIATFLTLVNLPALYVLLFRIKPEEASKKENDNRSSAPEPRPAADHDPSVAKAEEAAELVV